MIAAVAERLIPGARDAGVDGYMKAHRAAFAGAPEASSVVDRWGFVHGIGNLGVLGASVFRSTGGVNPTVTVQALAWRTATRLSQSDMFSDRKSTVFEESA